jgi:hypothetical protein
MNKHRLPFLLEQSRTSQEELMFRVAHRDRWLTHQLLAQAILVGLALGFKIGGIEPANSVTTATPGLSLTRDMVLALCIPVSLILALMYSVEDQLIGKVSQWRAGLAAEEARLSESRSILPMWESSTLLRDYGHSALRHRLWGQMIAFGIVPFLCFAVTAVVQWGPAMKASAPLIHTVTYWVIGSGELALLAWTFWLLTGAYRHRLQRYQAIDSANSSSTALVPVSSRPGPTDP